ncbi:MULTISPECIES: helix-turn-helix domain-containing protein [Aquimarina]|uniref:helix-turn-helix domain-containing protein n=1 Tax=Aquimarina TaxID=290174 RepID=UPI0009425428|nr:MULTISPECIES: helix-turn-helix domain-containing protein [Aquimarina]
MEITGFDLLLIIIIGHCLYLILSFKSIPQRNKGANKILQYLLIIYGCILLEGVLVFKIKDLDVLMHYRGITTAIYFIIGPLIYTYLRRLLFSENGSYNLTVLHYLPAIIFLFYSVLIIITYDYLREYKRFLIASYFLFELFAIISISIYCYKSYRLSRYFQISEKLELSFNQTISKYINRILFIMSACMFAWSISVIDRYISKFHGNFFTDLIWLLFGAQAYVIGYYSLKQPKIFKIRLPENGQNKSVKKNKLGKDEINKLQKLMNSFLEDKKGYVQPRLSLPILANQIGTTSNNLSWLLNNVYGKTFYQLINEYRVKDFLQRVDNEDYKELTLISIALEVGFNSKSTFYKAFKEIKKITPSEYISKIENSKQAKKIK